MRTRGRSTTAIFALALCALAVLPPARAGAVGYGDSAGGSNSGSAFGPLGSPGAVTWYKLRNTDHDNLAPPPAGTSGSGTTRERSVNKDRELTYDRSRLDEIRRKAAAGGERISSNEATKLLMEPCRGDNYYQNARCPLWFADKRVTDVGDPTTWFNVHSSTPWGWLPVTSKVTIAYNIKVWRENRDKHRFDLIFERRIGIGSQEKTVPERGAPSLAVQRRWWYGGITDSPDGDKYKSDGRTWTRGGSFSVNRARSAGPLGQFSDKDRSNCLANWKRGKNGERLSEPNARGKRYRVTKTIRPTKAKGMRGACYWEGSDIGERYFRWGSSSGYTNEILRKEGWGPRPSNLPNNEFGDNRRRHGGLLGKGLQEAIWLKWKLPLEARGKTKINYKIEGAPGLLYAVHIVALDNRENIMPIRARGPYDYPTGNSDTAKRNRQYFRAFISNRVAPPPRSKCPDDPPCEGPPVPFVPDEEPLAEVVRRPKSAIAARPRR